MKPETLSTAEDLFAFAPEEPDEAGVRGEEEIRALLEAGCVPAGRRFELRAESCALRLAHANNKILSLSNSRTRILAHQVESTHRIVNSLNQRFIIADEVGLGKTIEAGLVIKELIYRHGYSRILIVAPASLLLQWQHEMENKFNERFEVLDRRFIRRAEDLPLVAPDPMVCVDYTGEKRPEGGVLPGPFASLAKPVPLRLPK